jgi:hypothetical protein
MSKAISPRTLPEIVKQAFADLQPLLDELADTMDHRQRHAPLFLKFFSWYTTVEHDARPFLKGIRLPRAVTPHHTSTRHRLRPLPPLKPGA